MRKLIVLLALLAGSTAVVFQTSSEASFMGKAAHLVFGDSQNPTIHTVLILGEAGPGWTAGDLTDTILLAIFQNDPERATLLSLPRDLFVKLPNGATEKINTLWKLGRQNNLAPVGEQGAPLSLKVEEVTGLTVDDIVVIDTTAVEQIINALGGIALNVEEPIDDPAFPTRGGGVEHFTLAPGFQILDGKTAVQYARTRHTPRGDFDRLRRQHQVLQAMLAKAKGLHILDDAPKLLPIYEALHEHVRTTLSFESTREVLNTARALPAAKIQTFALETLGSEPLLTSIPPSYLVPKEGTFTYNAIRVAVAKLLE